MGSHYFAQALAMVLIASMLAVGSANKDWKYGNYTGWGFNHGSYHLNETKGPNKITVGGSENWHYGFDYKQWAWKNGPFYINDTLGEFATFCSSLASLSLFGASKKLASVQGCLSSLACCML